MYVSTMGENEKDVHQQRIQVAVCDTPDGSFKFIKDLIKPFSIDPHVVLSNNELYMFYSVNDYEVEKAGTRIIVDKMDNPFKLNGNPVEVVSPSIPEEIFMKDRFKKGQDWYTIEGACYFYESGVHYLLYSANCYESEFYFVNYATSDSKETDLRNIVYYKQPSADVYKPLLARNDFEEGTGHNSVINYNGEWYIVYHGREIAQSNQYVENRTMRIGKLVVENGTLRVDRHK
jgi:GH43 family beta-xylosidase